MLRKFILVLLLALLTPHPSQAARVCDDFDHCLTFTQPYSRIIPLYGAFNEMLIALGADELLVARTIADKDIPKLSHLPEIGTHMRPNAELVLALKPDLILQMAGRQEASLLTENLRELGLSVLTFDVATFPRLFEMMEKLGELTGREEKSRELADQWRGRLQALASSSDYRPKIYYEARHPQLLAAGAKSMVDAIITAAGGKNIVDIPKKLARLNEETLLLAQPEICVIQKGPMNPDPTPLGERPNLKNLPCVKNNMVFTVSEKDFARPGPNSIEAAEQMAQWVKKARELR